MAVRTPRDGGGDDSLFAEAAAQAVLNARKTPLRSGGDLGGGVFDATTLGDFLGVTPRPQLAVTPNLTPHATPSRQAAVGGAAPGSSLGALTSSWRPDGRSPHLSGSARAGMPSLVAADTLGVNELDGASAGRFAEMPASVRKRFDRERRQEISVQLSSLPAPVNEYSIVMPDVSAAMAEAEAEEREVAETMAADQDALDVTEREYASGLATEANASATRSSAFQREMPQPVVISRESASAAGDDDASHTCSSDVAGGATPPPAQLAHAARLVAAEAVTVLEMDHDADGPLSLPNGALLAAEAVNKRRRQLKPMELDLLSHAEEMLQVEAARVHAATVFTGGSSSSAFDAMATRIDVEVIYVPALRKYTDASSVPAADVAIAREQQLHLCKNSLTREGKNAAKLEKKLELLLGGYRRRSALLSARCETAAQAVSEKQIELGCFAALADQEDVARSQVRKEPQLPLEY